MIPYDSDRPLIFIHVPKCAGTSVRQIVEQWFSSGAHRHYRRPETRDIPKVINFAKQEKSVPQLIFGHFSVVEGLGIQSQYPQVTQFVTILRDPLETAISEYFYLLKRAQPIWKSTYWEIGRWVKNGGLRTKSLQASMAHRAQIRSYTNVEDYINCNRSKILDHFPVTVTEDNYVEVIETMFVEIGVLEHLEISLRRIAAALGQKEQIPMIPHLNQSNQTHDLSEQVKVRFRKKNALVYKIYDYVKLRFEGDIA